MLLQIIYASIASIITLYYIVALAKGKKYKYLIENLNAKDYALKDMYVAGFAMNDSKLFKMRGNVGRQLMKNSKLINGETYAQYYAVLAWAQFLSIAGLIIPFAFAIAALVGGQASFMVVAVSLLFVMAAWNLVVSKMKEAVQKRRENSELEFPNMVSKLALLINSGMVLRDAWKTVAYGKEGDIYDLMRAACEDMNNGYSDTKAIYHFGVLSDSVEIKKFSSVLIQAIEKGNGGIGEMMLSQVEELWAHKRQVALQQGEVAAGKLIIPLAITFAGIIMIIVVATMSSMSF